PGWSRRSGSDGFASPPLSAADYSLPQGGNQGKTGQKGKGERADKRGSVAPAGVTRWDRQPFLSTPGYPGALATYPQARPSRPYSALPRHACLFGVAPDGGCLVSPPTRSYPRAGTRLCGPLRHVAMPGRYPASPSVEPGLSSALACGGCLASSHCDFIAKGTASGSAAKGGSSGGLHRTPRPAPP